MNRMIIIAVLFYGYGTMAQTGTRAADSIKKAAGQSASAMKSLPVQDTSKLLFSEDEVKAQLILLALNNPAAEAADANVRIAEIARRKAGSSFLSTVNVGGNVNEFVVNNSPAASFFPKYNFGLTVPLDLFAKNKAEKRTATEMIIVNKLQKRLVGEELKAKVLIQYEVYKERKQLLELQRIVLDDDQAAYEKAQKDFKDDVIAIEEVNKIYSEFIKSKGNLITKEKELNVTIIEIEEIIGVPLKTVLEKRQQ